MTDDSNLVNLHPDADAAVGRMFEAFFLAAQENDAEHADVMEAIAKMLTFQLSLICPDCRKLTLKQFKKLLPRISLEAAQFAATIGRERTCH